jgi:hypothetical protein
LTVPVVTPKLPPPRLRTRAATQTNEIRAVAGETSQIPRKELLSIGVAVTPTVAVAYVIVAGFLYGLASYPELVLAEMAPAQGSGGASGRMMISPAAEGEPGQRFVNKRRRGAMPWRAEFNGTLSSTPSPLRLATMGGG